MLLTEILYAVALKLPLNGTKIVSYSSHTINNSHIACVIVLAVKYNVGAIVISILYRDQNLQINQEPNV